MTTQHRHNDAIALSYTGNPNLGDNETFTRLAIVAVVPFVLQRSVRRDDGSAARIALCIIPHILH
jgi:hypothetical protein